MQNRNSNSLWKRGKIFHQRLKNEKNSFIVEKPLYLHLTCSRQGKPVILSCLGIWKNISVKNFERSWASLKIKILIERGCSLLRYFNCSIGFYMILIKFPSTPCQNQAGACFVQPSTMYILIQIVFHLQINFLMGHVCFILTTRNFVMTHT